MNPFDLRLPADASFEEVAELLDRLNGAPAVSGVLLQLPVPDQLDGATLTGMVDPDKDVDCLTPVNAGRLALGAARAAALHAGGGARAAGRRRHGGGGGRSRGRGPLESVWQADGPAAAGGQRDRDDVPLAHPQSGRGVRPRGHPDRRGRPSAAITREHVKPGAVVIDVGVNRLTPEEAGNRSGLVGDVDFDAVLDVASAITPVPGGVGQMTAAMLLRNTLQAARRQVGVEV